MAWAVWCIDYTPISRHWNPFTDFIIFRENTTFCTIFFPQTTWFHASNLPTTCSQITFLTSNQEEEEKMQASNQHQWNLQILAFFFSALFVLVFVGGGVKPLPFSGLQCEQSCENMWWHGSYLKIISIHTKSLPSEVITDCVWESWANSVKWGKRYGHWCTQVKNILIFLIDFTDIMYKIPYNVLLYTIIMHNSADTMSFMVTACVKVTDMKSRLCVKVMYKSRLCVEVKL